MKDLIEGNIWGRETFVEENIWGRKTFGEEKN